jgi:hypothetical protein
MDSFIQGHHVVKFIIRIPNEALSSTWAEQGSHGPCLSHTSDSWLLSRAVAAVWTSRTTSQKSLRSDLLSGSDLNQENPFALCRYFIFPLSFIPGRSKLRNDLQLLSFQGPGERMNAMVFFVELLQWIFGLRRFGATCLVASGMIFSSGVQSLPSGRPSELDGTQFYFQV